MDVQRDGGLRRRRETSEGEQETALSASGCCIILLNTGACWGKNPASRHRLTDRAQQTEREREREKERERGRDEEEYEA